MNNETKGGKPLTIAQRKAFADLLKPHGTMRDQVHNLYVQLQKDLEGQFMDHLAKQRGAIEVADKLRKSEEQTEQLEKRLESLGFRLRNGKLEFHYEADDLVEQMRNDVSAEIGSRGDIDAEFDEAIAKVWAAQTLDEAKKIIDGLNHYNFSSKVGR